MITKETLSYYHTEQEYAAHDALGTIFLKNVGSVLPYQRVAANSNRFEFVVSASSWLKKAEFQDHREFYFTANSEEERDEWITTIELLKAVAVHQGFQAAFGADLKIPGKSKESPPVMGIFDKARSLRKRSSFGERDNKHRKMEVINEIKYCLFDLLLL